MEGDACFWTKWYNINWIYPLLEIIKIWTNYMKQWFSDFGIVGYNRTPNSVQEEIKEVNPMSAHGLQHWECFDLIMQGKGNEAKPVTVSKMERSM